MRSKGKPRIALLFSKFGDSKGLILLEVAIGLSIIAIISGFFLNKTIVSNKILQTQKTKNNIEIVSEALAAYLSSNNRLPFPSSSIVDGCEDMHSKLMIGIIPYNTIGISKEYALDGKRKPLIYMVDTNLCKYFQSIYDSSDGDCFCQKHLNHRIIIKGQENNLDMVAFVLDVMGNQNIIDNDKITIIPNNNTRYFRRNFLLIHYLQIRSCDKIESLKNEDLSSTMLFEKEIEDEFNDL